MFFTLQLTARYIHTHTHFKKVKEERGWDRGWRKEGYRPLGHVTWFPRTSAKTVSLERAST